MSPLLFNMFSLGKTNMKKQSKIRKQFSKQERIDKWNRYNQRCAYCGCELPYKDMQIDHINSIFLAKYNEQNNIVVNKTQLNAEENLLPACRQCNFYKSSHTLEEFRKSLVTTLMNNLRKNFQFKLAVKYGLITDNCLTNITFYFEGIQQNDQFRSN